MWAENILAWAYKNAKQYDKAIEQFKESYNLCLKLYGNDTQDKLGQMVGIADSYRMLNDSKSGMTWAKEMLDESIRLCGEKNLYTLDGKLLLAAFYRKDETTIDEAIEILENVPETASEFLPENDPIIYSTIKELAEAYHRSLRWKEAIPLYEKVIERNENLMSGYGSLTFDEKRSLISENSSTYVNAATLYYKDNNFKDAFRTLERGKSQLLIDSYSEQLAKSSGILDESETLKLNEYKSELIAYNNLIDAAFRSGDEQERFKLETEQRNLSNEYTAFKKSLQNKYPKYKTVSQANKLDFEQDKKILPDDTAFVEFMINGSSITAFVFDKNSDIKAAKFDAPENFLSQCNFYRQLLAYPTLELMQKKDTYLWKLPDGNYKFVIGRTTEDGEKLTTEDQFNELKQSLSKSFGEILLTPIKNDISKYPNLIISPDGDLNNIPFETLEFNDKLAIETFNISYVPSFSVMKLMQEADEKISKLTNRQDLFAMGNAYYGNNGNSAARRSLDDFYSNQRGKFDVNELRALKWKNLDGTEKEIERVSKLFGTKKIFTKKSASETNLKASNSRKEISNYKYLLFAAHGHFIPYAPAFSSIVLSQGVDAKEDGYVTIGEWMGMDLNSDLIFLSACESGLGEYQAGEGIIGIPYALTIAGNKNTVMSLWKVYDAATAEFVSTFFKKIREGKSSFIALNETKREFLKSENPLYKNPAVWSAFLLYGF